MTYLRKNQPNRFIVAEKDFIWQAAIYGQEMISYDRNLVQGDERCILEKKQ